MAIDTQAYYLVNF